MGRSDGSDWLQKSQDVDATILGNAEKGMEYECPCIIGSERV